MKLKNTKNLFVICVSFLCNFSAFGGLSALQSTGNCEEGLGTTSQMVIYIGMVFSGLFIAPVMSQTIGVKKITERNIYHFIFFYIFSRLLKSKIKDKNEKEKK